MLRKFSCFYEILEISKTASRSEVKNAFYKQAKIHHPDLTRSTSAEFNKLKEAYDILIDEDKRYQYDLKKGYLNAFDIDNMEIKMKKFGSRYISDNIKQLSDIDDFLQYSFQFPKKKTIFQRLNKEDLLSNHLVILRVKFLISLIGGFYFTFSLLIYIIEEYVYPTNHKIKIN